MGWFGWCGSPGGVYLYDFGARTMTYSSDDSTLLQVLGSPPQQWLDAEKRDGGCWMEAVGPGYAATRLRGYAATRLRGYACCGFERRLYSHCRHLSFPYFPYLILVNRRFGLCSWCNCFRSSWFCFLVVRHCWKFPGLNSKEFLCSEELPIPHDITRVIPYFVDSSNGWTMLFASCVCTHSRAQHVSRSMWHNITMFFFFFFVLTIYAV